MEESQRARARSQRFGALNMSVRAREDVPGMSSAFEFAKSLRSDPRYKKMLKEAQKRAGALAVAQQLNGPGLYVDRYLRSFLAEYNSRIFAGEGMHMPNSFNIMRAFVEPDEKAMVLRLLPEQFDAISFTRLLDHVTDPVADTTLTTLADRLDDLHVFEINMLGGYAEFRIPGAEEHVFCGLAFCREGDEISIMGVFGRSNPLPRSAIIPADTSQLFPGKDFLLKDKATLDLSDEALFGNAGFVPIILMTRVDAKQGKVQVRYVFEELKDSFNIITDDPQVFEDLANHKGLDAEKFAHFHAELNRYEPLFELLHAAPSCLNLMDSDDVSNERHPTGLRLNGKSREARKTSGLPQREAPKYVAVRTLYDLGDRTSGYDLEPSGLSVETSGFWKTLPFGGEGRDRNGNPIHGKTWVVTKTSWFESLAAATAPRKVRINTPNLAGEDVGEIYVMRNATHPRNVYKIGYTTKTSDDRARQLGATSGQPDIFNVVQSWRVRSPRLIEHEVHELLKEHRLNAGREFFDLRYEKIREIIEGVIAKANASLT